MPITQAEIRKYIQQQRQALTPQQQSTDSAEICQQIINSGVLNQAQHIAIYLPVRGEADPTPLLHMISDDNKQFYLPILSEQKTNHLAFAAYNEQTNMRLNKFKIPEPDVSQDELLHDPTRLDAVIMPLVAVDPKGNRIGMGGGYYDRTFSYKLTDTTQTPVLVAFAYDFQFIDSQTPQAWDVPADCIALQSRFIKR